MSKTTPNHRKQQLLLVNSSGRQEGSVSRSLAQDLLAALESRHGTIEITHRDLADGIDFVHQDWINANFTAAEDRSLSQRRELANSDQLVEELVRADILIIGVPIYNFGVPAVLKAWVDMVARARKTFRYTDNGPEGLLQGKKAYLVIASGGVPVDSPVDFATPYMRQALRFLGITDIEVIAAEQLNSRGDDAVDAARQRIAELLAASAATGATELEIARAL
jgi:FMN-dependent NADH-azoreductase